MIDLNRSRNLASPPRAGCFLAVFMLAGSLATSTPAQTFTTFHSFTTILSPSPGPNINSDGVWPNDGLVLSANTLFGTTEQRGGGGYGTVFAINIDGAGFMTLHNFRPVSILTFDTFRRTPTQTKPTATREQLCLESAQLL